MFGYPNIEASIEANIGKHRGKHRGKQRQAKTNRDRERNRRHKARDEYPQPQGQQNPAVSFLSLFLSSSPPREHSSYPRPTPTPTPTPPKQMSQYSPSFYIDELTRALKEAAFGIASYDVLPPMDAQDVSQDSQAVARVTLLEGMTIYLRLSIAGYQVRRPPTSFLPPTASTHTFSLLITLLITITITIIR